MLSLSCIGGRWQNLVGGGGTMLRANDYILCCTLKAQICILGSILVIIDHRKTILHMGVLF